jgi:VWFA-related protein
VQVRRGFRGLAVPVLVLALLSTAGPRAQQQGSTPPPPPPAPANPNQQPFRAGTNFVRVDVYPTQNGAPLDDLKAEDFEVAEDGKPQKIETFEHIQIESAPETARVEPSSPSQANQLAADPHRRVFVIYLDTEHVDVAGSHAIKQPLIDFLNNAIGADDLVGVMMPMMSPDQITLGRKSQVIEEGLVKNWAWGRTDSIMRDEREQMYEDCFPPIPGVDQGPTSAKAQEMITRRRERVVLDSLRDTIRHFGAIREGRTAIVTVTNGWILYGPNTALTNARMNPTTGMPEDPKPGTPAPIGVGPKGVLTTKNPNNYGNDRSECDKDLMELAAADDHQYFLDLLGEANRANVSFYPIDPRGLPVFDSSMANPLPLTVDHAVLQTRETNLRVLAENTDGIALLGSNDLRAQMRRLTNDLTSYYLLGYASTNTKLDGGYRKIRVRVKRPGVAVRARNGYRAATASEFADAKTVSTTPSAEAARPSALTEELGNLERVNRTRSSSAEPSKTIDVPGEPVFFRRGQSTGNVPQRAANRQFSRTERLHIEMLPGTATNWTAALLDRNGKTLPLPVATGERIDNATGQRWLTADVQLAPLGAGEYALELTTHENGQEKKILRAIRVTP